MNIKSKYYHTKTLHCFTFFEFNDFFSPLIFVHERFFEDENRSDDSVAGCDVWIPSN